MLASKGFDFLSHYKIRIGDGSNTRFWLDTWILDSPLFFCDLNGEGEFRVKDICSSIDDIFLPFSDSATRWVKTVPIKVSILAWCTRLDRLLTRVNLIMRGVNIDSSLCPVCSSVHEDSNHLFFLCDLGKSMSQRICRWWNIQWVEVSTYVEWYSWFISIRLSAKLKLMLEGVFILLGGISGPSGTMLSLILLRLEELLRSERKIVLAVASSGIASLLLPARRTAHSRFVIPRELLENSSCGIKQNTYLAELMQEVELIIWDEALMTQKYAFEALDKTLRDILGYLTLKNRNKVFGGLTVLLEDEEDEPSWIEIHEKFLTKSANSLIEQIFAETYPNFIKRQIDDAYLREKAILTPRNDDANAINAYTFEKFDVESINYNSADEICKASTDTLD
nr:RNA-directed DNA polymerase, eukaryota [Tanacetum cinerariifolium]